MTKAWFVTVHTDRFRLPSGKTWLGFASAHESKAKALAAVKAVEGTLDDDEFNEPVELSEATILALGLSDCEVLKI